MPYKKQEERSLTVLSVRVASALQLERSHRDQPFNKARVKVASNKIGVLHDAGLKRDRGFDSGN